MVMWETWKRHSKTPYWYAYIPEHPNATSLGYVLEHRLIMENHLDRLLTKEEVVHHNDGDKKNNDINNLKLLSVKTHNFMHAAEKKIPNIELVCAWCGESFTRRANKVRWAKHIGQTRFCCSYRCNGKLNH